MFTGPWHVNCMINKIFSNGFLDKRKNMIFKIIWPFLPNKPAYLVTR